MSLQERIATSIIDVVMDLLIQAGVKDSEGNDLTEESIAEILGAEVKSKKPAPASKAKSKAKAPAKEVDVSSLDEFTIVLDYGPKSHALFGDTKAIKDKLMEMNKAYKEETGGKKNLLSAGPNLTFRGVKPTFGWTITDKDKLDDVKALLDEIGVTYSEEEKGKRGGGRKPAADKEDAKADKAKAKAKPGPKPKADAKAKPGPKPKAEPKPKADSKAKAKDEAKEEEVPLKGQKNDWGNFEEPESGFVFVQLPVGTGSRKVAVVVGTQNTEVEDGVKGLDSVNRLTDEEKESCDANKWRVLTDENMAVLAKKDKKMHAALTAMLEREPADPEADGEDGAGDEEKEGEDADADAEADGEEGEGGDEEDPQEEDS